MNNSRKVTLFCQDIKVVFSRVNKVASSTIDENVLPPNSYRSQRGRFQGQNGPDQLPADLRYVHESWDGWFSFAFVRNPWDRMVSAYSYLTDHGMDESFDDFVFRHNLPDTSHEIRDHTIPCHLHTHHEGTQVVDYIGRFENFDEDIREILPELGRKREQYLPVSNPSSRTHYADYYNGRTRKKVAEVFAEDIDLFGYRYELQ